MGMALQLTHVFSSGIKRFFSGIFLSRISGLGRDLAMAYVFGDHPTVAAFMMAFRFANLFRRFFGEGPLQSVFIPHFEGLRAVDPEQAYAFFRKLTFLLAFLLIGLIFFIEGGVIIALHGFSLSLDNQQILQLTASFLPCLLFICLYGINISILQCHNSFFVPSVAPLLCNLSWIGGVFYLRKLMPETAMPVLVKYVFIGFVLQWLVTIPFICKKVSGKLRDWIRWQLGPEVKKFAKSFSLGIFGVGAIQINAFLDAVFARCADLSGPVYLWYSIRFQQLALAVFGIAAVNTLIPLLSQKVKRGLVNEGKEVFSFGMRRIFTVMFCCTLAVFPLGYLAIDLVYGRGNFSSYAVAQTTHCFWAYSLGLIPAALVMLVSAVFYAQENFLTPTIVATLTVGVNILLNSLFVFGFKFGSVGVALTTSIGSWLNYILLHHLLRKQGWKLHDISTNFAPLLKAGCFAMLLTYIGVYLLPETAHFFSPIIGQLVRFFIPAGVFVMGLFAYAYIWKNHDLLTIFHAFFIKSRL